MRVPGDSATLAAGIAAQIAIRLASLAQPALREALAQWPRAPRERTVAAAADLAVLRWLPQIAGDENAWGAEIVNALCRAAPGLAWRQTYAEPQVDRAFIDNYGYSELMGSGGPLASERIACGFLLLGPATYYPPHRHEAEEFYVPLSGTAGWQQGDGAWREHPPGTAIHHRSEEPHAMRTGAAPLLALYVWRSNRLAQRSRLDAAAMAPRQRHE